MKKNKSKETKRRFFRTLGFSLVILLCPTMVFMGSAKAYEAIRENGFAEKVSALQVNADENQITFKFFDHEMVFNKWYNNALIKEATSNLLLVAKDVYDHIFDRRAEK